MRRDHYDEDDAPLMDGRPLWWLGVLICVAVAVATISAYVELWPWR